VRNFAFNPTALYELLKVTRLQSEHLTAFLRTRHRDFHLNFDFLHFSFLENENETEK